MRTAISEYCTKIGMNSLLVQGAGGNVSWKDGNTLWIKASGTWLVDALKKDIFVPVDLDSLIQAFANDDYSIKPRILGDSVLRPSIETFLHALMPHPVVVHLHAIDILSYLVRQDAEFEIQTCLGGVIPWAMVDYYKPGAKLAMAVRQALDNSPSADVIFLQNHGVVIGGADIEEIASTLSILLDRLSLNPCNLVDITPPGLPIIVNDTVQYLFVSDPFVQQLAMQVDLFHRLESNWALYPDHVVFLGDSAKHYQSVDLAEKYLLASGVMPDVIFIERVGVFGLGELSIGKRAQLRCYADILLRQPKHQLLNTLSDDDIAQLLNWDAEKYRMSLAFTPTST